MFTWGVEFLQWFEQLRSPITNAAAIGLSAFGSEEAYLALLTVIYLCIGHRLGMRLMVLFLVSAYVNTSLKLAFHTDRPYLVHPELKPLWPESGGGYGFPSGHTQNAVAVWGAVAGAVRGRGWRVAVIALIALIGISRWYLQVHWPMDVLGGAAIGGAILVAVAAASRLTAGSATPVWHKGALVLGASVALLALMYPDDACARAAAALLGVGIGYLLLDRRGYDARAGLFVQAAKSVLGLGALMGLKLAGSALLGRDPISRAGLYAVIGFCVAYVLPVLLGRLFPAASPRD